MPINLERNLKTTWKLRSGNQCESIDVTVKASLFESPPSNIKQHLFSSVFQNENNLEDAKLL